MQQSWFPRKKHSRLSFFFVFGSILSWAFSTYAQVSSECASASAVQVSRQGKAWVEQTLRQLTLEEKVGQMLQVPVYGNYPDFNDLDFVIVRNQIQKFNVGSVDFASRMSGPNLVKATPGQVAAILNELQRDSKLPLLVGGDIERGLASRVSDTPEFPFPMAFGAIDKSEVVEKFATVAAQEARAVGIQWAYAPVADVNSDPNNPIINTRSFGEDPAPPRAMSR